MCHLHAHAFVFLYCTHTSSSCPCHLNKTLKHISSVVVSLLVTIVHTYLREPLYLSLSCIALCLSHSFCLALFLQQSVVIMMIMMMMMAMMVVRMCCVVYCRLLQSIVRLLPLRRTLMMPRRLLLHSTRQANQVWWQLVTRWLINQF